MKWLLLIWLIAGDPSPIRIPFDTRSDCLSAAAAFAEVNPSFEWLDRQREPLEPDYLVVRPMVGCLRSDEVGSPEY